MKKFILILVNYNGAAVSLECINSILKIKSDNIEKIIVVDNNSNSEDIQILKSFKNSYKNKILLEYIYLPENLGYFGALNKAIETIKDKQKYYVIIGNNDLLYSEDFCTAIESQNLKDHDYVLSPNIVTVNNIHQNPLAVRRLSLFRRISYKIFFLNYWSSIFVTNVSRYLGKNRSIKDKPEWDIKQYIRTGFGACYILTPKFFNMNQNLLSLVFLNGEEPIFSYQVHSSGGKILYCPEILVIHMDHTTFKKFTSRWNFDTTKKSYKIFKKYL